MKISQTMEGVKQDHRALVIGGGLEASQGDPARISVRDDCTMFVHDRTASSGDCSQHWKQINLIKVSLKQGWHLELGIKQAGTTMECLT